MFDLIYYMTLIAAAWIIWDERHTPKSLLQYTVGVAILLIPVVNTIIIGYHAYERKEEIKQWLSQRS